MLYTVAGSCPGESVPYLLSSDGNWVMVYDSKIGRWAITFASLGTAACTSNSLPTFSTAGASGAVGGSAAAAAATSVGTWAATLAAASWTIGPPTFSVNGMVFQNSATQTTCMN